MTDLFVHFRRTHIHTPSSSIYMIDWHNNIFVRIYWVVVLSQFANNCNILLFLLKRETLNRWCDQCIYTEIERMQLIYQISFFVFQLYVQLAQSTVRSNSRRSSNDVQRRWRIYPFNSMNYLKADYNHFSLIWINYRQYLRMDVSWVMSLCNVLTRLSTMRIQIVRYVIIHVDLNQIVSIGKQLSNQSRSWHM